MNEYVLNLLKKYKAKGVLPDTNLLLLYFIGSVDLKFVGKLKRISQFTETDFYLVSQFIESFSARVTTPHILTEVSNFLDVGLYSQAKAFYFEAFAKSMIVLDEKFMPSVEISQTESFIKFGLTDAAIAITAKNNFLVLTIDFPLYGYLNNMGVDAITLGDLKAF